MEVIISTWRMGASILKLILIINLRLHHFSQFLFNVKKGIKSWSVIGWQSG